VPEAWVINASPIILYARIGRLDVIERLAPKIFVPSKVIEEVRDGISKDMSARMAVDWATRYVLPDIQVPPSVEHWDIGPGESQVISHCLQGVRWAVLDDRMARRCTNAHSVPIIGSLGIILRAKVHGVIPLARPLVNKLKSAGMYVGDELIRQSLAAIGEED
jgi:predicted nucleic acid-binding protein